MRRARPDSIPTVPCPCRRVAQTFGVPTSNSHETIRQDRIDILVDLTMHMANNRLLVFACKPAPVQVLIWLTPARRGSRPSIIA